MLLLIDNYDSFTYNLYQYLEELGADTRVVRNDAVDLEQIADMKPDRVVISPGPSRPENAGISTAAVGLFAGKVPLLGVCLGHQCIAAAYGAKIHQAKEIRHGKTSLINHNGKSVFKGLPEPFEAVRYHSLAVDESTLPNEIQVTARTEDGTIMGISHEDLPLAGVQFHPESIMTSEGKNLLSNFLEMR